MNYRVLMQDSVNGQVFNFAATYSNVELVALKSNEHEESAVRALALCEFPEAKIVDVVQLPRTRSDEMPQ